MVLDAVLSRFVENSPVTVMAQLALERALDPEWLDGLFEEHRDRQYERELLFSTTVELLSLVAVGIQPSVHAAAQARKDLPVSIAALYDKINNTDPGLARALVFGSAARLGPVLAELQRNKTPMCPGYRVRVLDGNHLPGTEKRLAGLRGFRGAALPGLSLVVYDPDAGLVVDLVPGEDAHAGERVLVPALLPAAQPGDLWIADRNFCTRPILAGWDERGAAFIVREHGSTPNPTACSDLRQVGRIETGSVHEQAVEIAIDAKPSMRLRRIEVHLDKPTEDGDTIIRLLTNAPPSMVASAVAALYRRRWTIEGMFQWLESVLHSEIRSLGYPRAALFAFAVAVLAFNALNVVRAAVERQHQIDPEQDVGLSYYYVAAEVRASHRGMMIAVASEIWTACRALAPPELAGLLLHVAAHADVTRLRKHPRGPKKVANKGYAPGHVARAHVATARILRGRTKG